MPDEMVNQQIVFYYTVGEMFKRIYFYWSRHGKFLIYRMPSRKNSG